MKHLKWHYFQLSEKSWSNHIFIICDGIDDIQMYMWYRVVCGVRPPGKTSHQGPSKWLIRHSFKIFNDATSSVSRSTCVIDPIHNFSQCNIMTSLVVVRHCSRRGIDAPGVSLLWEATSFYCI